MAKQQTQTPPMEQKAPESVVVAVNPPQQKKQVAKARRPLSRAERDQLASDLRLVPANDDVELLGDRINQ